MTFYELIKACEKAVTHAEIRRLLMQHQDNDTIKELFRLMLDKSILYNIKKVPDYTAYPGAVLGPSNDELLVAWVHELLKDDLRGKDLKQSITHMHNAASDDYQKVIEWILDRQNPAKVGKSFVNKTWPGLIRVQEYMGAVPGTEDALKKLPWETGVSVQDKLMGRHCS